MTKDQFNRYAPFICLVIILLIIFVLWFFFGGQEQEFIGLEPLNPNRVTDFKQNGDNWEKIKDPNNPIGPYGTNGLYDSIYCTLNDNKNEADSFLNESDNEEVVGDNESGNNEGDNAEVAAFVEVVDDNDNNVVNEAVVNDNVVSPEAVKTKRRITIKRNPAVCTPVQIVKTEDKKDDEKFISKGERICCDVMKKIYGEEFTSVRPSWLKNPETNRNLELDCYNDKLKIAVEYNGIQHYEWPNFTNQSEEEFNNQRRRDDLKIKLCDYNGVYLITVPYWVPFDEIEEHIIKYLPQQIK